jgi:hypothetical protein
MHKRKMVNIPVVYRMRSGMLTARSGVVLLFTTGNSGTFVEALVSSKICVGN